MLKEVAASSLEPTHISSPLRTSLRRTRVVRGRVVDIDLDGRCVRVQRGQTGRDAPGGTDEFPYDHVVLALGAVANYLGNDAVREHSLDFKSLGDAIRIRNAVIAAFDAADSEPDPDKLRGRPPDRLRGDSGVAFQRLLRLGALAGNLLGEAFWPGTFP